MCRTLDLSKADDTTSNAGTSIASGLAELVAPHSKVIRVGVDNQCAAYDAVRAYQGDLRVLNAYPGLWSTRRLNVAQVSQVTDICIRRSVIEVLWVEVRPRRGAAVGVVSELMDMQTVLALAESSNLSRQDYRGLVILLIEEHSAADIALQNADCFDRHFEIGNT